MIIAEKGVECVLSRYNKSKLYAIEELQYLSSLSIKKLTKY